MTGRHSRTAFAVTLVALLCAGRPAGARSEEITVWSARALATVLAETTELVAKGEADLGVVVVTEILTTPGVELVGPFPAEVQSCVTFAAGVSPQAAGSHGATRLIAFLKGLRTAEVIRAQGMEPVP